mmetsp:Transcript_63381/g.183602  ORF Transcript_63381/g.183602 Transcript_63381/m.183602 type:complete len:96 (-) Transcript_63381:115-402(-)
MHPPRRLAAARYSLNLSTLESTVASCDPAVWHSWALRRRLAPRELMTYGPRDPEILLSPLAHSDTPPFDHVHASQCRRLCVYSSAAGSEMCHGGI